MQITMPKAKITFLPQNKVVEVDTEKFPFGDHGMPGSILDIALAKGVFLEHACGGNKACTTCMVWVKQGMNHLSEADDEELDLAEKAPNATLTSRLGCQAIVQQGEVTVEIPPYSVNQIKSEH